MVKPENLIDEVALAEYRQACRERRVNLERQRSAQERMDKKLARTAYRLKRVAQCAAKVLTPYIKAHGWMAVSHSDFTVTPYVQLTARTGARTLEYRLDVTDYEAAKEEARSFGRLWIKVLESRAASPRRRKRRGQKPEE